MLIRPLGRPKNRWEDDIINYMRKLKIKIWTSYIQDRNKQKLYVEKPKHSKNEVVAPKEDEEEEEEEGGGGGGGGGDDDDDDTDTDRHTFQMSLEVWTRSL